MNTTGVSKTSLIKLGLGGQLSLNSENQFIDDTKNKHQDIQSYKLDVINKGSLRYPELDLIIKQKINSQYNSSTYKYYSIPIEPKEKYSSESKIKISLFGQLSYYSYNKNYYNVNDNNYFRKFLNEEKIIGTDLTGEFSRFAFPSNFSNASSRITGLSYNTQSKISVGSILTLSNFNPNDATGNFLYAKTWTESDSSNVLPNNFSSYYIPYPNTIDIANYNAFGIPLKIASLEKDYNFSPKNIKGILMISTGNGINSKICYISPHSLKSGYQNTYVYASGNIINSSGISEVKKIPSGIMLKALTLSSEYYSGKVFPESGITTASTGRIEEFDSRLDQSSIIEITGTINSYDIDASQHLKQVEPIKDTLFYKFYSGLYTANKTFNTGTWDGIIPTGRQITVEFISTELNKELGVDNKFYFIYSGFGNNDTTDAKCSNYLSWLNQKNNLINGTQIKINGDEIKIKGYGFGNTEYEAYSQAQNNAKYNFFNKISNIMKKWTPEFFVQNRKFKSLKKFLNRNS